MINSELQLQVSSSWPKGVIFCQDSLKDVTLMAFAIQQWVWQVILQIDSLSIAEDLNSILIDVWGPSRHF
jgi:hypothetical protein